ncbi:TolC family protein [Sphingobacterium siyangense]|uniref:Outer membrane protein TolC n=1 Tax=Sphingobacterium siyangense TaxID=459529 RepID=A0A562MI02_9SPHI|nr:TolC family protein [Sphingobacterium siyangense]TWI19161.1 outer membrane protein TolC [Sphingobacterium siyangense]
MKKIRLILFLAISALGIGTVKAQKNSNDIRLTIEEAFDLAIKNSQKLKVVGKSEEQAKQKIEIAKLTKLPTLSTGLTYGYISNSQIWTPSFSEHQTAEIPHNLTQFSVQAYQVIFKGGEIDNNIAKVSLEEQIAALNLKKNVTDIKFLVVAKYLDIYQLKNQVKIIEENTTLAKERLKNINTLFKQGMVTNNDVLRTQLQISDLEIAYRKTNNDLIIVNQQLNMVLGLDESVRLEPDTSILNNQYHLSDIDAELSDGLANNQDLKITNTEIAIAEKNLKIIGAERYPEIALFACNNFQRPFTNTMPAIDIYSNVWQAGLSVRYNIGSLYQSPRKIKSGKIQVDQTREQNQLQRQNVELDIRESYIRYNEATANLDSYHTNLVSANENYRIVEKKYFNQLALLTDMIDASDTKIDAEIKVSNANITVLYAYYKLLRTKGTL